MSEENKELKKKGRPMIVYDKLTKEDIVNKKGCGLTQQVWDDIIKIYRIFPRKGALKVACMWTGMNPSTINNWRVRFPAFRNALKRAQAENLMMLQTTLVNMSMGTKESPPNITALIFACRTSWPKIYALDKNTEYLAASMAADAMRERMNRIEKILEAVVGQEKTTEIIQKLLSPTINGTFKMKDAVEESEKEEEEIDKEEMRELEEEEAKEKHNFHRLMNDKFTPRENTDAGNP